MGPAMIPSNCRLVLNKRGDSICRPVSENSCFQEADFTKKQRSLTDEFNIIQLSYQPKDDPSLCDPDKDMDEMKYMIPVVDNKVKILFEL